MNIKLLIKQFTFPLSLILLCYINLQYMHYSILIDKYSLTPFSYLENIIHAFIDICLLFFIPLYLIGKKTYLFFIPYTIITILVIVNVSYSRFFYTYMPPILYGEFNNLDGLSANVFATIRFSDITILITTLASILSYKQFHRAYSEIRRKTRRIFSLYILGIAFILLGGLIATATIHWSSLNYKYVHPFKNSPTESIFKFGIIYGTIIQCASNNKQDCNPEEVAKLEPFFYESKYSIEYPPKENIILIIVESLLSFPTVLKINGIEITPTLNKLVEKGAYYNNNMTSLIQLGESSDGQFTYLNGLIPKTKGVTIYDYFNNTFVSLPKLLKKQKPGIECRMVIPTSSKTWRQDGVCIQYGFDKLYSRKEYTLSNYKENWLNDKLLFEYAASIDKNSKQPFFSLILTSSTHSPYTKAVEDYLIPFPDTYSEELKNYLSNVHYMDKYLGKYLNFLKENHLYHNSLIIIASDHSISNDWLKSKEEDNVSFQIPLYIVNSPQKIDKTSDYAITQADLFPTLLDLGGIHSEWRGVGNSLLCPDSILNTEREKKRIIYREKISDIILDSDYFKGKKISK
ncbi:lipoteichoic acid synthase [Bacteroides ovatus]|uniref:Lipoteichoic acid synthase n=2 Tax=Bacteroides ovatus TaxID=28116 RepID=A0A1G6G2Y3_BACOV|nr:lipoteichoic acid synthase [Bacteroides ovatus]